MSVEAATAMSGPIFVDEETGEFFDAQEQLQEINNVETGEPEINVGAQRKRRKVPFQIPKKVQESACTKKLSREFTDIEFIPDGDSFGRINPICLFLPAIIYFRWFVAVLLLMETILHIYSHRKNKGLKNSNVYYQSPFHGISSEFCALCQSENCMNRVGKMQEARMHRFLKQCNYMKRVVT